MNVYHQILKLSLCVFLFMGYAQAQETQYDLAPETEIFVLGKSTLHDWKVVCNEVAGEFTLSGAEKTLEVSKGTLSIAIASMDGGRGATMNQKLSKALKATSHPNIAFEVSTLTPKEEAGTYAAVGTLALAGESKEMNIELVAMQLENQQLKFTGKVPLTMTEFGIDPPSAMFGQIQTADEIEIELNVVLTPKS